MAILAECPVCHRKQKTKNKHCACSADLDQAKRSKKVRYWITYRLPGGKQRKEFVGYSVEEARDADGKRRVQKRENRIFDIKPEAKMTFNELTEWYLELESLKAKAYYDTVRINLKNFNAEFGNVIVGQIKPVDLENYQAKRKRAGYSDSYIDQQIGAAKTMVNKAFDNDLVGGDAIKAFKRIRNLLKPRANARDRALSYEEYNRLLGAIAEHAKPILATALWTGMRRGEILGLTWDKVDLKGRMIRLEATDTKERKAKAVPLARPLQAMLAQLPGRLRSSSEDSCVFQFKSRAIKYDVKKSVQNACKKVGVPYGRYTKDGFIFHDLRHTFATMARRAGIRRNVIMVIMGHAANDMNFRYDTVDEGDLLAAVDQMEGYFASVAQTVAQVEEKASNFNS